jgi:hypothetical protein
MAVVRISAPPAVRSSMEISIVVMSAAPRSPWRRPDFLLIFIETICIRGNLIHLFKG